MTTFTKEQLAYWSQTQPLAAFALAQMERAENVEKRMKAWGCPDFDFICLNCGRETPCMTEADLKPGDPGTPCTFDMTYPQMIEYLHFLEDKKRDAEASVKAWQEKSDRHESERDSFRLEADRLREKGAWLQAEVDVLRGKACDEEQAEGNGPCGVCRNCAWAERDRIKGELEEAEEAILWMHEMYPTKALRNNEWSKAVRRARERSARIKITDGDLEARGREETSDNESPRSPRAAG